MSTKKILTLKTLEKHMTNRKSGNMEKAGFQAAMQELSDKGLTVTEVVTDAHLGIGALMSDGRNDTPGHSAQYCSYTMMEMSTKKILTLKTLDKRMTNRKSGNMEKAGFRAAMQELSDKGLTVTEVVTDAHLGIGTLIRYNVLTN